MGALRANELQTTFLRKRVEMGVEQAKEFQALTTKAAVLQRDLRAVEHHQQFGFVGVQSGQQSVKGGKASAASEYPVEAGPQDGPAFGLGSRR